MGADSLISSSFITASVILFMLSATCINADDVILHAKLGEPPVIRFTSVEREIKLICNFDETDLANGAKPRWSFLKYGPQGNVTIVRDDVAATCRKKLEIGMDLKEPAILRSCEVEWENDHLQLFLEIDDLSEMEFGDYVCHTGNMAAKNATFRLKELVYLTRKENGKHVRSVNLLEGTDFQLYCNVTGFQSKSQRISWWKDGENITDDLLHNAGLFQNFTADDQIHLRFHGVASMMHRGTYACQVDLLNPEDPEIGKFYPIEFAYFVRVKDGNEWQLPVYVLIGECVLIGLFTICINWRESKVKDEDMECEDSEDEDEPQRGQNGIVQNNNGK